MKASSHHRRISVDADAQIRCFIVQELHAARASKAEDFGLGHYRHFGNRNLQVICPESLQSV